MNKRPDTEGYQLREVEEFTHAELEAAIRHATDPREIRPRLACRPMPLVSQLLKPLFNERPD
jgi:hypothetical protein